MNIRFPRRLVPGLLLAGVATVGLVRAEKMNLDRIAPPPADQPIPTLDFFREPLLQAPAVNPAGTHVAAIIASGEDHTGLMVYSLKTQQKETLTFTGERDIGNARWLGNNRVMFDISLRKTGGSGLYASDVGALSSPFPLLQFVGVTVVAIPPGDRTHPLVRISADSMVTGRQAEVVVLNTDIRTGKIQDFTQQSSGGDKFTEAEEDNARHIIGRNPFLATATRFDLSYFADKEGRLAFGTSSTDGVLELFRLAGGRWEKCPADLEEVQVVDCGDNPGELVVVGQRGGGKPRPLQVIDGATGATKMVLRQDPAYDFNGYLYRDPGSHNIVGAMSDGSGPEFLWFTEAYRNLQKAVDQIFPGMAVRIIGGDDAGRMVLLSTFSDRQPPIYNWVDLEKHTAGLITNSRPWIDPKRMRRMGMIKYKTRDGRKLDAYLMMPAGATKQNPPPLIVLPHDNAEQRSVWGFDPEAQFFASRGYAVLQPNYRGSAGYRWMFPTEDDWDYRKMREDVADATRLVAGSGLVDSHRIAIMGTSFAGYLALAGAAFEPDLYQCAIAVSPVCDWAKTMEDLKFSQYRDFTYSRLMRKLGDPRQQAEKFDAISPLRHAGSIKAAVLIAYGEFDSSSAISQMKEIASTVRRNQVPADTISYLNEQHGVHYLEHQVNLYDQTVAFLGAHLGSAKSAPAAR